MLVFGGVFYGLIWNFPWFIVYPLKFQRKKDIQAASRKYHLKVFSFQLFGGVYRKWKKLYAETKLKIQGSTKNA